MVGHPHPFLRTTICPPGLCSLPPPLLPIPPSRPGCLPLFLRPRSRAHKFEDPIRKPPPLPLHQTPMAPLRPALLLPASAQFALLAHRITHPANTSFKPPLLTMLSLPVPLLHVSVVLVVLVEEPQLRPAVGWELLIVQLVLESGFQGLSATGSFLVRLGVPARCDYCRQVPTPSGGTVARLDLMAGGAGVAAIVTNHP